MRRFLLAVLITFPSLLSAQQYLIPAAASKDGQNGTHFRSDVAIWNFRAESQRILLRWLPEGMSGVGIPPVEITVPGYGGLQDPDFVANVMKQVGHLGAILILAVRPDGTLDPNARLTIQSRIWTPQPDTRGDTSQSFDAIRITQISGDTRVITNQRNDYRYRMNVGVVNLDAQAEHTWQFVAHGATTELPVPPLGMRQIALPRFPNSVTTPFVRIVGNGGGQTTWVAYGSSVDNVTGDAWTSLAYQAQLP